MSFGKLQGLGQQYVQRLGGLDPMNQETATDEQKEAAKLAGRRELFARLSDAFGGRDIGAEAMKRQMFEMQRQKLLSPAQRQIIKGADGFNYYVDTGERVLPDVTAEEEPKEYGMQKDAAGYLRYTEGPEKGQRVFPDVDKPEDTPDIKDEASLRKEFDKESGYFKDIERSYSKVLVTDPSAAGDVSLIFAYMKMLDPGSVVREGEQATAAQARGVPEGVLTQYNRLLTGEKLTPKQREDFRGQAANIYYNALDNQNLNVARYTQIAEDKGFKPSNIVFDYAVNVPFLEFENELENKTLQDLQQIDVRQYNDKQLKIIADVLAKKLKESNGNED